MVQHRNAVSGTGSSDDGQDADAPPPPRGSTRSATKRRSRLGRLGGGGWGGGANTTYVPKKATHRSTGRATMGFFCFWLHSLTTRRNHCRAQTDRSCKTSITTTKNKEKPSNQETKKTPRKQKEGKPKNPQPKPTNQNNSSPKTEKNTQQETNRRGGGGGVGAEERGREGGGGGGGSWAGDKSTTNKKKNGRKPNNPPSQTTNPNPPPEPPSPTNPHTPITPSPRKAVATRPIPGGALRCACSRAQRPAAGKIKKDKTTHPAPTPSTPPSNPRVSSGVLPRPRVGAVPGHRVRRSGRLEVHAPSGGGS